MLPTTPLTEALPRPRLPRPPGGRVFAICNQKGGVGKTTTAVTLAAIWAARGYRVRIIDCDPQLGGSTLWLLTMARLVNDSLPAGMPSLLNVFLDDCNLADASVEIRPNLWLVPSDASLKRVENERPPGAETALQQAIQADDDGETITILDCPPNLGVLTVAGLLAGQELVIPVEASGLSLPGVRELNGTLKTIRRRLNPGLRTAALLVTDAHPDKLTEQTYNSLMADYGKESPVVKVRHSVRAAEAPMAGQLLTEWAPDATTTADYRRVANLLVPGSVAVRA